MGLIISKWVSANKNLKENLTKSKESNIAPHEEFNNIFQTPKIKKKFDSTGNNINQTQRSKSLKSLKLDPRSPTVGIYRTPILVEEVANNDVKFCNFDSPISIYSSNVTNCSLQDIMTPLEPPVNVSGFEENKYNKESYNLSFDNSIPLPPSDSEKIGSLRVKHKPTTSEAKKLLEEINLADENSSKKNHTSIKKNCKMISKGNKDKRCNEIKSNLLKNRTPLSNITSSGNSPSYLATSGKLFSRSRTTAEFGSENSINPLEQQLARWDTNNTVII